MNERVIEKYGRVRCINILQTMAFVCSTCVDLDFGVESSLLVRYGLFGVVLILYLLFSES